VVAHLDAEPTGPPDKCQAARPPVANHELQYLPFTGLLAEFKVTYLLKSIVLLILPEVFKICSWTFTTRIVSE